MVQNIEPAIKLSNANRSVRSDHQTELQLANKKALISG